MLSSWCGAEEFFAGGTDFVFVILFWVVRDFSELGVMDESLSGGVELEFFGFEREPLFFEFKLLGVVFLIPKFEHPASNGFEVFGGHSG